MTLVVFLESEPKIIAATGPWAPNDYGPGKMCASHALNDWEVSIICNESNLNKQRINHHKEDNENN
jgi:hypothetical protein